MDIIEIINKKKDKKELSAEELQFFVDGVCSGLIKDYQTTSLLMAICLNGLSDKETYNLTMSMAKSGKMLDLTDVGDCLDKHSTGGVSDTTTLVIVPILASLGVKVAKMSGRSLGFTGGTADKMEVFSGYNTEISTERFKELIKQNGASIISQSSEFALADKIIYKLRSDSGTVESMGLIASSIMSKKIACGAKLIILDCKYGSGAFMKTLADCKKLARLMVEIGKRAGIKVCAVLSSMEQPLTKYVGNNFEVYSAIETLCGKESNLSALAKYICVQALLLDGKCGSEKEAQQLVEDAIKSKKALEKLKQIVSAQGGSTSVIENPNLLLNTNKQFDVFSKSSGKVVKIDTEEIGYIGHDLQKKNGVLIRQDNVGIILNVQLGDTVKAGQKLATIYFNDVDDINEIASKLEKCFKLGTKQVKPKLVDCVLV